MTATSGPATSARETYEAFAPYYDAFTASSDYEAWASHVLELAGRLGLCGDTLLDVACGTGKSFLPFVERGFDVTAADVSAAMLGEAAAKAPGVRLVQADMRELPQLGRFHLVTCFDDSLNYLLEETELASAFASIAANLHPDGIAMFDLNSLLAYRTTFSRDSVALDEETVFVWRGESTADVQPGCEATARIDVFNQRADGLYERVTTRHTQRHYPGARVVELLAEGGLDCAGVYGVLEDGTPVPGADEAAQLKLLYVARPARGGEAQ